MKKVGLLLVVLGTACVSEPTKDVWVSVVVSDVHMTFATPCAQKVSGDPVGGAIVGGLVAGTSGAIVGAVVGSEESPVSSGGLVACSFVASLPDGKKVTFRIPSRGIEEETAMRCSTLRDGDVLTLVSVGMSYRWGDWSYSQ